MGTWFLATAYAQFIAAMIAQFANVVEPAKGPPSPPPRRRSTSTATCGA